MNDRIPPLNGQNEVGLGLDNRDQLNLHFDNVFCSLFINSNGGESILFDNMEELRDNIKQYSIESKIRLFVNKSTRKYCWYKCKSHRNCVFRAKFGPIG